MHRLIRNFQIGRASPFAFSSNNPPQKNVPLVSELKPKQAFLSHVYGLELRSHIFPHFRKAIQMDDEEIKFYQKVAPNYVVGLIRKVIDDASMVSGAEEL